MRDFLPHVHFGVGGGLSFDPSKRNPYLGFVFGYNGISAETVAMELNRRSILDPAHKQDLPDFVFVAKPGYMVARVQQTSTQTVIQGPGRDFTQYALLHCGDDTLPLFYLALNLCLGQLRLKSVDFRAIWSGLLEEIIQRPQGG